MAKIPHLSIDFNGKFDKVLRNPVLYLHQWVYIPTRVWLFLLKNPYTRRWKETLKVKLQQRKEPSTTGERI
uniref:Uncharacterized protein n=1 Tax=Pyxicephalus adspersus TaxID=30357 RepID=A0AAV3B7W7_PYXAD|nr:TPA: hypothetical protein GDO54_000224 [Pyxicephalus adspersus]